MSCECRYPTDVVNGVCGSCLECLDDNAPRTEGGQLIETGRTTNFEGNAEEAVIEKTSVISILEGDEDEL